VIFLILADRGAEFVLAHEWMRICFELLDLFIHLLPLHMERTPEDQEHHLLVKVINRVLYKLDNLVCPYVHKILVVIEPLLIDEDYYARIEGREIISILSKAAGLAHMISTMRPDTDHADKYVRNTTACAFSVVALGTPSLLPFLKAVCRSKKSWQARNDSTKPHGKIYHRSWCR
jgi:splicing factor 3B subunit 1